MYPLFTDLSESPSHLSLFTYGLLPLFLLSQNINPHRRQTEVHLEYEDETGWTHAVCLSVDLGQNAAALGDLSPLLPWRVSKCLLFQIKFVLSLWAKVMFKKERETEGVIQLEVHKRGIKEIQKQIKDRKGKGETERNSKQMILMPFSAFSPSSPF